METTLVAPQEERALGTRLLRGAVGGLAVNLLTNGFLFVGQLLIPRLLGRVEYAQFTVAVSFVTVVALLADLGLTSLFTRLLTTAGEAAKSQATDTRGELLGSMLVLRIGLALLVSAIVLTLAPRLYGPGIASHTAVLLITLFISSRLVIVRSIGDALLRSLGKYYLTTVFCLIDAIAFAVLLILISSTTASLTTVIWIYTLCHVPGFLLLVAYCVRYLRQEHIRLTFDAGRVLELVRVGIPLGIGTAFLTLHNESDKLLLDKLSDPLEVSSYGATVRLTAAVAPIAIVLGAVAAPELTRLLSRGDTRRAQRLIDLSIRLLLVAASALALFLTASSHSVIVTLLGEKYASAAPLLSQMGWMMLPIFFATFLTEMSIAAGKYWLPTIYTFVIMLSVIVGDLLLIPTYGAAGAMTSKTIAVALGGVALLVLQRDAAYVDLNKLLRSVAAVGAALLVALGCSVLGMRLNIPEFSRISIVVASYATMLFVTRCISLAEIRDLLQRVSRRGDGA